MDGTAQTVTFEDLKANKKLINILLLGETGVGKSTFINAFANYLRFHDLRQAEKEKLFVLIPAQFSITNDKFETQTIYIDTDNNENQEIGVSATQGTRSYIFPLHTTDKTHVQLIDTPGIGDTRGIDQDQANLENILAHIGQLDDLHAICILLKPNNARLTVMFEFCIKQLLSRLEKSACKNMIFLFTNTRSTFYRPGDTLPPLKKILDYIKNLSHGVDIPLSQENMFCIDNEAFRFLAALNSGIKFSNEEKSNFFTSWKTSSKECERFVSYITGLEPHKVQNTISINEARRVIIQLAQPLAEIAQLIHDNLYALECHKQYLHLGTTTLADLKSKLFIPVINLKVIELAQPTTVCTNSKCCRIYQVGDINKFHYEKRCHEPCYLSNVPREVVGSPQLVSCSAMDPATKACLKCKCDFSAHMHVYYVTETFSDKLENDDLKSTITDKETALDQAKKLLLRIEKRKYEFERERETIIKSSAKFAHFLKNNAITPYNDSYKAYLAMLIDREKSMGILANEGMLQHYDKLLKEYLQEKEILDRVLEDSQEASNINRSITAADILKCIQSLYYLKHNGKKIKELFLKQKMALENEYKNSNDVIKNINIPLKKADSLIPAPKNKNKKKNKNKSNIEAEAQQSAELLEKFTAMELEVAKLKEITEQKSEKKDSETKSDSNVNKGQQNEQRNQNQFRGRSRPPQRGNFRGNYRGNNRGQQTYNYHNRQQDQTYNTQQELGQKQSYQNQYGNQAPSNSPNFNQSSSSNQQYHNQRGTNQQYHNQRGYNQQYHHQSGVGQQYPNVSGLNQQFPNQRGSNQQFPNQPGSNRQFPNQSGSNQQFPNPPPQYEPPQYEPPQYQPPEYQPPQYEPPQHQPPKYQPHHQNRQFQNQSYNQVPPPYQLSGSQQNLNQGQPRPNRQNNYRGRNQGQDYRSKSQSSNNRNKGGKEECDNKKTENTEKEEKTKKATQTINVNLQMGKPKSPKEECCIQ